MKSIKVIIICSLVAGVIHAQTATEKKLPWDYPVKPGTEEWKQLNTIREAIDVCQIPEDVLYALSTEDLTQICLQYPNLYDIVIANTTYDRALDRLFETFNGIRELFKRKDASKELLKQYHSKMQDLAYLEGNDSDLRKGYFIASISSLELLLSCHHSLDDSKEIHMEILQQLMVGHEQKIKYADYFKGIGFHTNFFTRAHLIVKIEEQNLERIPQKKSNSVFILGKIDETTERVINELSYQLIKEK